MADSLPTAHDHVVGQTDEEAMCEYPLPAVKTPRKVGGFSDGTEGRVDDDVVLIGEVHRPVRRPAKGHACSQRLQESRLLLAI